MPHRDKSDIGEAMSRISPKLVIVNSSTSQGRYQQMLRLRPTLLARVRELTVGPMYLIIETALEQLIKELEALPPGSIRTINAFEMDPSQEDHQMLEESSVPVRRGKRSTKKDAPNEPSGADSASS